MVTMITLASGNTFFYLPETYDVASYAYIVDDNFNFVGGFLADEADRKLAAFSKLQNVKVAEATTGLPLHMVNFDNFAAKLGAASTYFLRKTLMISDYEDCNGTYSHAKSCSDRQYYYKAVGCSRLYRSRKRFPVWAFIANHVAIFGVENFRQTFFRGAEANPATGLMVDASTRYDKSGRFQAPAYYVRAVCQNR